MFKHLEAFHTDNSARQSSVESDYGVRWHLQPWRHTWRVFYIRSTGGALRRLPGRRGPCIPPGHIPTR